MSAGEGRCKRCRRSILWVKFVSAANPHGKPHPLDPVPGPDGSIERKRGTLTGDWYARVVPASERKGNLYISHFATCPMADER